MPGSTTMSQRNFSAAERAAIDCEWVMEALAADAEGEVFFRVRGGYVVWEVFKDGLMVGVYHPDAGVWARVGFRPVRLGPPDVDTIDRPGNVCRVIQDAILKSRRA